MLFLEFGGCDAIGSIGRRHAPVWPQAQSVPWAERHSQGICRLARRCRPGFQAPGNRKNGLQPGFSMRWGAEAGNLYGSCLFYG